LVVNRNGFAAHILHADRQAFGRWDAEHRAERTKQNTEAFDDMKTSLEKTIAYGLAEIAKLKAGQEISTKDAETQIYVYSSEEISQTDLSYQYLESSDRLQNDPRRAQVLDKLSKASHFVEAGAGGSEAASGGGVASERGNSAACSSAVGSQANFNKSAAGSQANFNSAAGSQANYNSAGGSQTGGTQTSFKPRHSNASVSLSARGTANSFNAQAHGTMTNTMQSGTGSWHSAASGVTTQNLQLQALDRKEHQVMVHTSPKKPPHGSPRISRGATTALERLPPEGSPPGSRGSHPYPPNDQPRSRAAS